jgi:hypothetical protein
MTEVRTSRGSIAWVFVLLGPTLTMAFAMAQAVIRGAMVPGDMTIPILVIMIGLNPVGLLEPWAILILPFALTGLVAFRLDGRVSGPKFTAICAVVGATATLLSAPMLGSPPVLSVAVEGGLAAMVCALASQIRLWTRPSALGS